jgi:dihydroorotate dehydrogenase electron transfer subunit
MKFVGDMRILSKEKHNSEIFSLTLEKPNDVEMEIKAGQFFNFMCSKEGYPLLRRPISVSFVDNKNIIFYIQKKGLGTKLITFLKAGEKVNVLGPLGNGFNFENVKKPLIVGGGIGTAPMIEVARTFKEKGFENVATLLGYKKDPYGLNDFKKFTSNIRIASEENESYTLGFVTKLLEEELELENYDMVYTCGPEVMLKNVVEICNKKNVKSQVLMEEKMACGIGACLVCSCKVKSDDEGDYKNLRTCKDGPVFMGNEVIFNE